MMRICIYFLFLSFIFITCSRKNVTSNSANVAQHQLPGDKLSKKDYIFPDDWLGNWSGDLEIFDAKGLKQVVPMSLDLSKTDTTGVYTWAIIYGKDSTAQRRNYQLKEIDTNTGHYVVDEKNGIFLDAFHIHNELNSVFEVMGNTLLTSYRLEKDEMVFSVKFFPSKEVRISGDTLINEQEIPVVNSFHLTISQIARLKKIAVEN